MYIESLSVKQFRCFEEAAIEFQYPGRPVKEGQTAPRLPNVNLLLGDNGTGKTAVLKAISLSVLAPIIDGAGFRPYYLVRRARMPLRELDMSSRDANIRASLLIHRQEDYPVADDWNASVIGNIAAEAKITRQLTTEKISTSYPPTLHIVGFLQAFFDENLPAYFLAGYGATRRVENSETFDSSARSKTRALRYQRVAGLFEDYFGLTAVNAWRMQLQDQNRLDEGVNLLNKLLSNDVQLYFFMVKK